MYNGLKIKINEEELIVPALSLGQLRNGGLAILQEHDKLLAENNTFEAMQLRGDLIFLALQRNYPDFDKNKLLDFLDMANSGTIWLAVLGSSGFTPGET